MACRIWHVRHFECAAFVWFRQRRFLQEQTDKVNDLLDHMKQRAAW